MGVIDYLKKKKEKVKKYAKDTYKKEMSLRAKERKIAEKERVKQRLSYAKEKERFAGQQRLKALKQSGMKKSSGMGGMSGKSMFGELKQPQSAFGQPSGQPQSAFGKPSKEPKSFFSKSM